MLLQSFAQAATQTIQTTQSTCTLNGRPVDCDQLLESAKPFLGLGVGLLLFVFIIGLISFIFWVIMLIHALRHNSPDKNMWLIILLIGFFTGFSFIAAISYFFIEKKKAEGISTAPVSQSQPPTTPAPEETSNPTSHQQ